LGRAPKAIQSPTFLTQIFPDQEEQTHRGHFRDSF
jgi:hypothetical protein